MRLQCLQIICCRIWDSHIFGTLPYKYFIEQWIVVLAAWEGEHLCPSSVHLITHVSSSVTYSLRCVRIVHETVIPSSSRIYMESCREDLIPPCLSCSRYHIICDFLTTSQGKPRLQTNSNKGWKPRMCQDHWPFPGVECFCNGLNQQSGRNLNRNSEVKISNQLIFNALKEFSE